VLARQGHFYANLNTRPPSGKAYCESFAIKFLKNSSKKFVRYESSLQRGYKVVIFDRPHQRTISMLQPTPGAKPPSAQGTSQLSLPELFDVEETPLLRYAFSLTGRRAVAEEIVQEVFLLLHSRWGEVDAPRAWLFRTVRNKAFTHRRDHGREVFSGDEQDALPDGGADEPPEQLILRMEATGALRQLIAELPEMDRRLVTLKYFDDLKYREISEQTGVSISNVGYRLHHILKQLADKLRPFGVDNES
jgi:RNA polymerase sigma-70 factor (ECF subfamily)